MHPNTPDMLARLVTQAERSLKAPAGDRSALCLCEELWEETKVAIVAPFEGEPLVDQVTVWLAQALYLLEREGPHGKRRMKFEMLARTFLPFVKTDFAIALDRSRPATTDNDYPNKR